MLEYKPSTRMIKTDLAIAATMRKYFKDMGFKSKYRSRNVTHALLILKTLEVTYQTIEQFIFIPKSEDLMDKLGRLGYNPLPITTDELTANKLCTIMYNEEYNVAFHLYESEYAAPIKLAVDIATQAKSNDKLQIFLAGVKVLMSSKSLISAAQVKKQMLLG